MRKLIYSILFLSIVNFLSAQEPVDSSEFKVVEVMPEFPGGQDSMLSFIYHNIQYPAIARENGIEGTGVVTFIIHEDGSISDEKVLRDLGGGIGDEMLRMVRSFPDWKPGTQNGKPVRVQFNLPVRFRLENNSWQKNGGISSSLGVFHANTQGDLNEYFGSSTGGSLGLNFIYKKFRFDLEAGFTRPKVKQEFVHENYQWSVGDKVDFSMINYSFGYNFRISKDQNFTPYFVVSPFTMTNLSEQNDNKFYLERLGPGLGLHYEILFGKNEKTGIRSAVKIKAYYFPSRYTNFINGQTLVFGVDYGFTSM